MNLKSLTFTLLFLGLVIINAHAQGNSDPTAGIAKATDLVNNFYTKLVNLIYAVAGCLAIYGAFRVFSKWQHGDQDTGKAAMAWFGAALFLIVAATVLKAFFSALG
jgi:Domain of unknown function (DUF4134)